MTKFSATAAAAIFGCMSTTAFADTKPKMKVACKTDLAKFCKDSKKGDRKTCLNTHTSELEAGCKDFLAAK